MITEDNTLGFAVEPEYIQEFMSGKRNTFTTDLDDDTYRELLENCEGHLILNAELPERFHGCYWYNNGKFPYVLKESLENIMLVAGETRIVGHIVKCTPKPGRRFRFGEKPGEPSVEDPNGDSCIWEMNYELEPAE